MARKKLKSVKERFEEEKNRIVKLFSQRPPGKLISIKTAYKRSKYTLNDYVTLDYSHRREIFNQIREINNYRLDLSRIRPLNYLMPASPGTGKSHFVVLSSFLCKIFISQFLKEWQILTHFSDRV